MLHQRYVPCGLPAMPSPAGGVRGVGGGGVIEAARRHIPAVLTCEFSVKNSLFRCRSSPVHRRALPFRQRITMIGQPAKPFATPLPLRPPPQDTRRLARCCCRATREPCTAPTSATRLRWRRNDRRSRTRAKLSRIRWRPPPQQRSDFPGGCDPFSPSGGR